MQRYLLICSLSGVYPEHAVLYFELSDLSLCDIIQRMLDTRDAMKTDDSEVTDNNTCST